MTHETPTRRTVVAALGAVAASGLAACGSGDADPGSTSSAATPGATGSPATSAPGGASPTDTPAGGSAGGVAEGALADLADVPVGSAISVEGPGGALIVAQPTAGEVVGFDATCPHQGCKVAPRGDVLVCPCHGSRFQAATGKVLNGPARADLTRVQVTVDGTSIVAG